MTADATLAELAEKVGIFPRFKDMQGVIRPTSVNTTRALLNAQGFDAASTADVKRSLESIIADEAHAIIVQDNVVEKAAMCR